MIETPHVTESAAQTLATIPLTIPRNEIGSVMGPSLGELCETIAAQGIAQTGPWLTRHHRMDLAIFDFEICLPVATPVASTGRVRPGELASRKVATTVYHGSFEGLGAAWQELDAWVADNGYSAAPDLWEIYFVGPETSDDPADWRTELNRPLND
jgi:effector-binding domain-containing protein